MNAAPTTKVVTLDLTDKTHLATGIAELDDADRALLRDALRDYASGEADRLIMATIRKTLADEAPGQTGLGVIFTTMEYDNGYYLSTYGEVLFEDGNTRPVDFPDLSDAFTDEFGCRGEKFTVKVDLRPGALSKIDGDDYESEEDIHTRFGVRRPRNADGQFTVDGKQFDNTHSRDAYIRLKALPEEKVLYLARSDGYRLRSRMDATYRTVASEEVNPDWVTCTAARIALDHGWIDQEEYNHLVS